MSDYEAKCGVRARIDSLQGKTASEAYEYFLPILGKADEVDIFKEQVKYFSYKGKYQPGNEFSYGETSDKSWFVDYLLKKGSPFEEDEASLYLTISELDEIVQDLIAKFGIAKSDIMVFSYCWYNGADEPRFVSSPTGDS